ncbi:MAG TPA: nucleoside triphosphate pyrophosphatase [Chthoniobacterales bacterium]
MLASASPRRADLLREFGYSFEVIPADITEIAYPYLSPVELTSWNAFRKARRVAAAFPQAVVIGADTVVSLGAQVFGKPGTPAAAKAMLSVLSGRTHTVTTAYCLVYARQRRFYLDHAQTAVTLKVLSESEIDAYHAVIDPLDKAGAYAAQTAPERVIAKIEGLHSNVIGLPVEALERPLIGLRVARGLRGHERSR